LISQGYAEASLGEPQGRRQACRTPTAPLARDRSVLGLEMDVLTGLGDRRIIDR
jgi:hypothetical protein